MSESEPISCPRCGKALEGAPNYCPACGEDLRGLTPTADTLSVPWAGKVIDGRYRIREKLGEGGMGSVFKVEHVRIGKVLALKVLRADLLKDKRVQARFHQEARIVSKLTHPNTIQVFDFGELEDGSLYIAMEYLAGRDLSWTLRAHGPLTEERAIQVAVQVLSSLSEAHELGIIHRDIKPANCMLVKGRRSRGDELVKVLDFGIAKLMEGEGRKHITGITDFVGTPTYMSPEQASGEELDPRSDLYSLGAMLFELVSGRGPYLGPNAMAIVTQHLEAGAAPRLSEVAPERQLSPAFVEVVARALEKKRGDRFENADQMRLALEGVAQKLSAGAGGALADTADAEESQDLVRRADFDRFERQLRLRRAVAPLAVLLVMGGLGAAGYGLLRRQANRTVVAEREDNGDPSRANRIALGEAVRGHIGSPISDQASDRDVYELDLDEQVVLSAGLEGVPDLNLVLELTHVDLSGRKSRVFLDDAPSGASERVDGVALGPGRVYARIEERYHFTESPRPPRESSRSEYALSLRPTEAPAGALEVEPDDSLESATRVRVEQPVSAFTGAAVEWQAALVMQELSTADFFALEDAPDGAVAAVVVPPAEGKLAALDGAEFGRWRAEMRQVAANPPLPEAVIAAGKPALLPVKAAERRAIRVQPLPPTPAGTLYRVAFVTGRPGGLSAALELARTLDAEGRREDAAGVLRLVASAFAESPQLAEVRAALGL